MSDYGQVVAVKELIDRDMGATDILVNNAGLMPKVSLLDATPQDIDRIIKVNVSSHFYVCASTRIPSGHYYWFAHFHCRRAAYSWRTWLPEVEDILLPLHRWLHSIRANVPSRTQPPNSQSRVLWKRWIRRYVKMATTSKRWPFFRFSSILGKKWSTTSAKRWGLFKLTNWLQLNAWLIRIVVFSALICCEKWASGRQRMSDLWPWTASVVAPNMFPCRGTISAWENSSCKTRVGHSEMWMPIESISFQIATDKLARYYNTDSHSEGTLTTPNEIELTEIFICVHYRNFIHSIGKN